MLTSKETNELKVALNSPEPFKDFKQVCRLLYLWEKVTKTAKNNAEMFKFAKEKLGVTNLSEQATQYKGCFPRKLLGYNIQLTRIDTLDMFLNPDLKFKHHITAEDQMQHFIDTDSNNTVNRSYMKNHSYRATDAGLPIFVKSDKEHITKEQQPYAFYYGVELEVMCRKDTPKEILFDIEKKCLKDFCIVKSDSSIGTPDSTGFEICTVPATYRAHKEHWLPFFDEKTGSARHLKSWITNKCGIHIHISRMAFTKGHLARFVNFVNAGVNKDFVSELAGRTNSSYCQMDSKYTIMDVMRNEINTGKGHGKYSAVNLSNAATVEVRIFRGNTRKAGFFKCLEFVDSLVQYTRDCGYSRDSLHYDKYLEYLCKNGNGRDYSNLMDWLAEKEYIVTTRRIKDKDETRNWRQECV